MQILKIIVDSVVSEGTSTGFVTELKKRLSYELAMTQSFNSEAALALSFDVRTT